MNKVFAGVSINIIKECKNIEESFGIICVKCNKCGRFNENSPYFNQNTQKYYNINKN